MLDNNIMSKELIIECRVDNDIHFEMVLNFRLQNRLNINVIYL